MSATDTIEVFELDNDEGRTFLTLRCMDDDYRFWISDIEAMRGLLAAADRLRSHVAAHDEAKAAYKLHVATDPDDGYEVTDPKHSRFVDHLEEMLQSMAEATWGK